MFETTSQTSTITSVNLRNEIHGDEHVGAVDIGITMTVPNTSLSLFDPELISTFYKRSAGGQLEMIQHLPDLKFPDLAMPVKWSYVGLGYDVSIDYGMNGDQQLKFITCQVDKFKFDMQAGGSVEIALRIIAHPEADDVGKLYELLGDEIELTLTAPQADDDDAPQQTDLLDSEPEAAPEPKSKGKKSKAETVADVDVLYPKAVAAVRATGNPDVGALQVELKIGYNHAATLLARMLDEGVIEQDDAGQYVVVEDHAEA